MKISKNQLNRIIKEELSRVLQEQAPQFDDPVNAFRDYNRRVMTRRIKQLWERILKQTDPRLPASARVLVDFELDEGINEPISVTIENVENLNPSLLTDLEMMVEREFKSDTHKNLWPGLSYDDGAGGHGATVPYTLTS